MTSRIGSRAAFTLVELLVVIGIIAVLIGLLLPAMSGARESAMGIQSMSNLRTLGMGLDMYKNEYRGFYPRHSSIAAETTGATPRRPRTRWADDIFPYVENTDVYLSPLVGDDEYLLLRLPFAHTCDPVTALPGPATVYWGGYGYNYQYLGNARKPGGVRRPFHANSSKITAPALTIAIADTRGSKNGTNAWTGEATYAIDPPLMSVDMGSKGSRRSSATPGPGQYGYTGGSDGDPKHRATPAERNRQRVNVLFCDGHGERMSLQTMDDFDNDGVPDNGYWNGVARVDMR